MLFDRKHVDAWIAEGIKVIDLLRGLSNTVRGIPPHLTRMAIMTCAEPNLLCGHEVWYHGLYHGMGAFLNKIDITLKVAIGAILPTWETTPLPILRRESLIPTARVLLNGKMYLYDVRSGRLDHDYPLVNRTYSYRYRTPTQFQRTAELPPGPAVPALTSDKATGSGTGRDYVEGEGGRGLPPLVRSEVTRP